MDISHHAPVFVGPPGGTEDEGEPKSGPFHEMTSVRQKRCNTTMLVAYPR